MSRRCVLPQQQSSASCHRRSRSIRMCCSGESEVLNQIPALPSSVCIIAKGTLYSYGTTCDHEKRPDSFDVLCPSTSRLDYLAPVRSMCEGIDVLETFLGFWKFCEHILSHAQSKIDPASLTSHRGLFIASWVSRLDCRDWTWFSGLGYSN
jgi:hypothetical protein